ncbi:MAG: glycosyltransferase [Gemmatimonadales bacterium]
MTLRFSVVIPSYQRRGLVVAAVGALARQRFGAPFEIIVVVDGSTDGSTSALRALDLAVPLAVIEQPNRGASAARNRGADSARGELLLFLDDDMEADIDLLAKLDESHRAGADVVFGHLPLHPGSPAHFLSDGIRQWADGRLKRLTTPGECLTLHDLMTGQMSLAKTLFDRVGGFDLDFTRDGTFGDEDIDFGYRLIRAGCRLVFNPEAISHQNYVVQPAHYLRQWREAGRADVAFARKHPEKARTIFALNGSNKPVNRFWWRPLASLRLVSAPLMSALRWIALRLVREPMPSDWRVRFFYQIWAMQYWRGVSDAGGIPRRPALRVLAYHAIQDMATAPVIAPYAVPPRLFRHQLTLLQRLGFTFVSAEAFRRFLTRGAPLPRLPVLLTFDDGYADLLEALPFLEERRIPAVVFVVAGNIGGTNTWDQVIGAPRLELLGTDSLRTIAKRGIEVGGHSRTHRPLSRLPEDVIHEEIAGSLDDLVAAIGARPSLFAYPEGDFDGRVKEQAGKAGLEAAFAISPGLVRSGDDPYAVPRIEILAADTGWRFLWKVFRAGRWTATPNAPTP